MSKFKRFYPFVHANEKGNYFGDKTTTVDGIAYEYNIELLASLGYYSPNSFMEITEEHKMVVYEIYWEKSLTEILPDYMGVTHFDFYFNKPQGAMECLQLTCNEFNTTQLVVDGKIGPKTKRQLNILFDKNNERAVFNTYNMFRLSYYTELLYNARKVHGNKKAVDFILSWSNRVKELY